MPPERDEGPATPGAAGASRLPDPFEVEPLAAPPDAEPRLPGSKSITNRALVCAALAEGTSVLSGALVSDDTEAMSECLGQLGVACRVGERDGSGTVQIVVEGTGGSLRSGGAVLDARLSGTTSRFIAPVAVLAGGTRVLDGAEPLRRRPMADLLVALGELGAEVVPLGDPGCLPVELHGGTTGVQGGEVSVRGDVSSQFLSGLLLAAPAMRDGLRVRVVSELVSRPYVDMTVAVMRSFGADVSLDAPAGGPLVIEVAPGGYRAREFAIEPDASAASYFFALAAAGAGRARVEGLGTSSLQGDLAFVDVLASMGASVERATGHTEVRGTGQLHGVEVDMVDISDTAPTLGAIAPLATGPVTVRGIGFVRGKETDRIASVVTELERLGIDASESADGFTVRPGLPSPAVVSTYNDHRMAMSFAVLGLLTGGVSIADPHCVDKTFPGFWDAIESLRGEVSHDPAP